MRQRPGLLHSLGWLLVGLLAWLCALPVRAAPVDARAAGAIPLVLAPTVEALEDPGGQLTLAEVQQPDQTARFASGLARADGFNFGITPSAWWFRITLANPGDAPIERLLEVAYARLSHLALYGVGPDGSVHRVETGGATPFASRPYAHRFFVFPLRLEARSERTYYLRVQSLTAFIVPLRLWEPSAFHAYERNDYTAQAWYLGMATAMVLFNFLIFAWTRERIYLFYVCFAFATAFSVVAQNGLVKEFLRLDSPLASDLASTFGYSLAIAAGLQFMRHMLDTAHTLARWDRPLGWLAVFFAASPLAFLFTGQALIQTAAVAYLGAVLVAVAVGLQGVWKRQRTAYFFMAAFLLLSLGAITNAARAMGLLPTNLFTANAMQAGSALEMVLLAFALADRFNQMRRERAAMHQKLLAAQDELIENLRRSEQQLEQHVQERTVALQVANRQLAALSMTDGLTGIANRRHLDETLENEWQRARRSGEPLTLALLDVDWFKAYNDRLGHQAGDECLRRIARILAGNVHRNTDLVARYGGEEFAFLAPATDGAGVVEIGHKIQTALHAMALKHPDSPLGEVTVSMGIATLASGSQDGVEALVRRADDALYRAKAEGRNRIVLA